MKINMPVTDNEIQFSEDQTLVSKTDLKGSITYVNKEFIKISGFTEEELIGQNHNIVRHPDMPPEAFQDLWDTLKAGKPWIQMVKNRCKNGDYYWVKANVTPIMKNGQVVEYMSVRAKPTRDEIAAAEVAFKQMKDGKLQLKNGNAITSRAGALKQKLGRIRLTQQFAILGVILAVFLSLIAWELGVQKKHVDFAARETLGVEYVAPVRQLLEKIPQHRGMTNAYLNGEKQFEAKILDTRREIDSLLAKTIALDSISGAELQTSAELQGIKTTWDDLKNRAFTLSATESFERHTTLIAQIQHLIIVAGEKSNLILDSDLASSYATDMVIYKIPALVEFMGLARGLGSGLIAAGNATPSQQDRLIELTVALKMSSQGVYEDLNGGSAVSQRFANTLGARERAARDDVSAFVNDVLAVRNGSYRGNADQFFQAGTDAIKSAFALWDETHKLLDVQLRERIDDMEQGFLIELVLSLLCALIFVVVAVAVSRNILRTLSDSLQSFNAIVNGNYQLAVPMHGDNELSQLTRSINSMRIKMGFEVEDAAARAAEASRIKQALDVAQTNVMMSDPDFNIIYMNDAIRAMFENVESAIKTELPNFAAKHLMGQNVDIFHKKPEYQRQMMAKLTEPHKARIVIGGRTFDLVATPVFTGSGSRLGTVVEWDDVTETLRKAEEEQRIANENLRIKQALDNVSANVMVADPDRNIIYMNESVIRTLRNAQEDLRKDLPQFDVDKLQGASIDIFHKHPEHQAKLLKNLKDTYNASILVGGRTMDLSVNPIINEENERLGTVVEWKDRTLEVAIEKEVDAIVEAAAQGDMSKRVDLNGKTGFFKKLSEGLNDLLESSSAFISDIDSLFANMSDGDLTRSINRNYAGDFERIKVNANNTIHKLTDILTKVRESANTVHTAANEIAQGNADLSQRTEEQASSLEETASSMEEITSTVKQSSDNASEANLLANEARDKAQRGGSVVQGAISAMSEILESSNKINDIIGVIDEIAFQTNLLALNAAVEAARAGEQGRGFAVVAGEVRNLSQRSAAAAREIKDLIRDSVSKVETGSTLVNDSGETLTAIVHAVEKVARMIQEVNNAAREQTSGIEQINQAVAQMDEMTQQNAALVEQAAAASEAMSEQASGMNRLISFFQLGDAVSSPAPIKQNTIQKAASKAPLQTYKPQPDKGTAASFSSDDDWEDF